ncbi:HD-GYP domain-containing protein [Thalassoroseus pseudoceratinae]|uniref:HD-GYP domain-containing protein n=1 Tax=Thalassoroseus pseudoceratinae TaxID=2713176 RepID=UPI0014201BC0|nr:HD domain-containing phosphohydrolase [Thalassoroseus pseudoceratinae]
MSDRTPTVIQAVSVSDLRPGAKLPAAIYDARNPSVLLLGSGMRLSPENLERLQSRGVTQVAIESRHLAEICAKPQSTDPATDESAKSSKPDGPLDLRKYANKPLKSLIKKPPRKAYSAKNVGEFQGNRTQHSSQVRQVVKSASVTPSVSVTPLKSVTFDSMDMIINDVDIFVKLAIEPPADPSTNEHCLRTAQLAMAIATTLDHTVDEIQQLGMGCMISRVGMTQSGLQLVAEKRHLSSSDHVEIQKNPCRTFDLLQETPDMPMVARQVAYQMFERWDGSGYPRARAGSQIHPLACVAAVADVYVALSSPRPHRPAFTPYRAIEQLIADTRRGLFDPRAIRGLLQVVCLFPLGTYVELNDGSIGCVVRNNSEAYDRPVLELLCDPLLRPTSGQTLNLEEQTHLRVERVLSQVEIADIIQASEVSAKTPSAMSANRDVAV